jgi:hypothetical protein
MFAASNAYAGGYLDKYPYRHRNGQVKEPTNKRDFSGIAAFHSKSGRIEIGLSNRMGFPQTV